MCTAALIRNGRVGWAPPPVVSPMTSARPSDCSGILPGPIESYLLQALASSLSGIYFPALELTETISLRLFADELIRFSG
jgi:uncharacterized protein